MVFKKRALNTVCKIARYAVHVQTSETSTCGWVFWLLSTIRVTENRVDKRVGGGGGSNYKNKQTNKQ